MGTVKFTELWQCLGSTFPIVKLIRFSQDYIMEPTAFVSPPKWYFHLRFPMHYNSA
jgi:hypothetical protein